MSDVHHTFDRSFPACATLIMNKRKKEKKWWRKKRKSKPWMEKVLIRARGRRVQKQLDVQTLIRACSHQHYKCLPPVLSLCSHYCVLSSSSFGVPSVCRTFSPTLFLLHVKCSIRLESRTAALHAFSRQTSSRWKVNCGWSHMRRTLKKQRIHLLSYADQWWLVCLPVLHFTKKNQSNLFSNRISQPNLGFGQAWTQEKTH